MKKINQVLAIWFFVMAATNLQAQNIKPVSASSKVSFVIKNLGINATGYFKEISGLIYFDFKNPANGQFEIIINTKSLDTDNSLRDKHLVKEEYFDIETFPSIKFTSTKISQSQSGNYELHGKLTIKDIVKDVSFPFTATKKESGIMFEGKLGLNRRDFGVGGRSFTLSDNLTVNLNVFAK